MDNNRRHGTHIGTVAVIFVASSVALPTCFYVQGLNVWPRTIIAFLSLPVIPLSFIALVALVVQGVRTRRIERMEAWWWLSAPYAAALPFSFIVFNLRTGEETIALFAIPACAGTVSSVGWMLTTLYRATISKRAPMNLRNLAMTGVVLLACASWAVLALAP